MYIYKLCIRAAIFRPRRVHGIGALPVRRPTESHSVFLTPHLRKSKTKVGLWLSSHECTHFVPWPWGRPVIRSSRHLLYVYNRHEHGCGSPEVKVHFKNERKCIFPSFFWRVLQGQKPEAKCSLTNVFPFSGPSFNQQNISDGHDHAMFLSHARYYNSEPFYVKTFSCSVRHHHRAWDKHILCCLFIKKWHAGRKKKDKRWSFQSVSVISTKFVTTTISISDCASRDIVAAGGERLLLEQHPHPRRQPKRQATAAKTLLFFNEML